MSIRTQIASLIHYLANRVEGLDNQAERETRERALNALGRLKSESDATFESHENEAQRRAQLGLLDEKPPEHWRSFYYVRQGFRIVTDETARQGHWRGGKPLHENAICPHCNKALLLFFEINCQDSGLRSECPELIGSIGRLPLYYCCRRPEPTVYQLLDDGNIRMLTPDLEGWETSPFSNFPEAWERRAVRLELIPRDVENLMAIDDVLGIDWLNGEERKRIQEYLGSDVPSISLTQFGGRLVTHQGHRERECPNKLCLTHQMGHPIVRNKQYYQMKQLAVISDDPAFEMETNCAQIVFNICWKCRTILAEYQCD